MEEQLSSQQIGSSSASRDNGIIQLPTREIPWGRFQK
jgi:hypothetical protein